MIVGCQDGCFDRNPIGFSTSVDLSMASLSYGCTRFLNAHISPVKLEVSPDASKYVKDILGELGLTGLDIHIRDDFKNGGWLLSGGEL